MGLRRSGTIVNSHVPDQSSSMIRSMYAPHIARGIELEDKYINNIDKKLYGDTDTKDQLISRIIGKSEDGRNLLNKPMYEELNKIPINDQLRMMNEHFKTLKNTKEDTDENERQRLLQNMFLSKGEVLS